MIPIPLGMQYGVTLTGRVPKLVQCEACAYEYVYLLEASAAGSGFSPLFLDMDGAENRAHETAYVTLDSTLQEGYAVVPCAGCGHIQAHMIPKAKIDYHQWMFKIGVVALAIAGILFAPALVLTLCVNGLENGGTLQMVTVALWTGAAVLGTLGLILPNVRLLLARRYDPNAAPVALRKAQGEDLSVSKAEYLRMLQGPS